MNGESPSLLSKYYSLERPERVEDVVLGHRIFFPSPRCFNDPFDCRVNVRYRGARQQRRRFLEERARKAKPAIPRRERRRLASENRGQFFSKESVESQNRWMQERIDEIGVACFSADPGDILMWSHYAASHSGVCLRFLHGRNEPFFGRALAVNYRTQYPLLNYLESDYEAQSQALLLTKSAHWSYEQEWRIIEHRGHGPYEFDPSLLHEIVLGCRISDAHVELVAAWLSSRNPRPKLSRAKEAATQYALEIAEARTS